MHIRELPTVGLLALVCFIAFVSTANAQKKVNTQAKPAPAFAGVRSTSAFAEVLLRETEFRADLESLLLEYTEDYPKVKEARFAISLLEAEKNRLLVVSENDMSKLTLALGKIQVKKIDAEIDLWRLQQSLADAHPDVKRARKKVEIFENAIKEILG